MHRGVVEACVPCVLALAVSFALLRLLVWVSGAKIDWRRLRGVHRCETGGVQSLAFVLTLPMFTLIVLFIIQVAQVMIGLMVVHYAAYAAGRAATVWLPSDMGPATIPEDERIEPENLLNGQVSGPNNNYLCVEAAQNSVKFQKIQMAAVLACAPMCPSHDLQAGNGQLPQWLTNAQNTSINMYSRLSPTSSQNPRVPQRIRNKLAYSYQNTQVNLAWMEAPHPGKDVLVSPTYNPRGHPDPAVQKWHWRANEVGWEDPITVQVTHQFALMPGPGRFLIGHIVPAGSPFGPPCKQIQVGGINLNKSQYSEPVYTTTISASATFVNEGLRSVIPYVQQQQLQP